MWFFFFFVVVVLMKENQQRSCLLTVMWAKVDFSMTPAIFLLQKKSFSYLKKMLFWNQLTNNHVVSNFVVENSMKLIYLETFYFFKKVCSSKNIISSIRIFVKSFSTNCSKSWDLLQKSKKIFKEIGYFFKAW